MENHFLKDFVKENESQYVFDEAQKDMPWYNPYGDCIVFQTANEAVVADRIDDFLTIYRSALDGRAIGFQLKDILALIKTYGYDGLKVRTEVDGDKVVSVRALLFAAYESRPGSIHRRKGYAEVPPPAHDEVVVRPVAA